MTDGSQSYNLRAIRELLQTAFNVEDLRGLFSFAMNPDLRPVADQFTPEDSKPAMVRKAVEYCRARFLLKELLTEVKEANPRAYRRFEPELVVASIGQPAEEATTEPTPEILTITSPIYLDLVRVPAGEFLMGSVVARDAHAREDEFPPHRVYVPEFHIGQYPVTNLQYQAFVKAAGHEVPRHWESGKMPGGKSNHPVVEVTWYDALAFCTWLSEETGQPFRLPTEAQWEKASRGTDGRVYPWGDQPPDETLCNFDNVGGITPIGRFSPQGDSPYGCADMAGNVFEWCQSEYRPYPYRAGDGREEESGGEHRVLRGGTYWGGADSVRCASRLSYLDPNSRSIDFGFRVASGPLIGAP